MDAILSVEQIAWLQSGVCSIVVAASTPQGRPVIGMAFGCRADASRRHLVVFLLESQSHELLSALRGGRGVSALFTQSTTTQALQLKAPGAREVPLQGSDASLLDGYAASLAKEWSTFGQSEAFTLALMSRKGDTLVAFELTPEQAFDQTPGPRAGSALSSHA